MSINMRVIGFCGMDDSVSPDLLELVSSRYPWVEWGVLFRNDLEGTPRYPSRAWVDRLASLTVISEDKETVSIRLAGHLCGNRCQEVLEGDFAFVQELFALGYRRVQVNATAANSVTVDKERINQYVQNILSCMKSVPKMEFIIQCNDETKPIYTQLVADSTPNMSVLYDASCGKGIKVSSFPDPMVHPHIRCGYAGGIGPDCIEDILTGVKTATDHVPMENRVWVDMESSLRTIVVEKSKVDQSETRKDVFSIDKVFACVLIAQKFGMK